MMDRPALRRITGTGKDHERTVTTVCRDCSVGCGLVAYVGEDRIVDVQGEEDHPVSRGRLCARGIAFVQGVDNPDRIVAPLHRESLSDDFQEVENWDKALDLLSDRLRRTRERHGPESLLIGCDPEAGADFYFCAKRFARLWGTPLVLDPFEEPGDEYPAMLRSPNSSCTKWIGNQSLLLVESDLATTHPVAFSWLVEAQRNGAKIIVADSRFTRTMSKADLAVLIRPQSGNQLGTALMKMFLDRGAHSDERAQACFTDPAAWKDAYAEAPIADLAGATGLSPGALEEVAALLAGKGPSTLITAKKLAYRPNYGIWLTMAIAMGWSEDDGGGWYPLRSERPPVDVVGDIEEGEEKLLEWLYGDHRELLKGILEPEAAAEPPSVKALVGSGNCLNDFLSPLMASVPEMDVIAYFGAFPNATRNASQIVFPATMWPETDSICFSNDGAVQWAEKIVDPAAGCKSGLDFWIGLAQRLGWEDYFPWVREDGTADHAAFWDWLLLRSSYTAGLDVDQLKRSHQESRLATWPTEGGGRGGAESPPSPTPDGKITPTGPGPAAERPVQAQNGYPLYFHSSQAVSRSRDLGNWLPWTEELEDDSLVQINPEVAEALNIESGDEVVVQGATKSIEGRAWISRMVPAGIVQSQQPFEERWVLVHRKNQSSQEALSILKEQFT